jgi:hypothetical protein
VATAEVEADHELYEGATVAVPLPEVWLHAHLAAGTVSVAAINDLAPVSPDGFVEAMLTNVLAELLELTTF